MENLANQYFHEITRLTDKDTFLVFDRVKDTFEFPMHYHEEFELNFITNGTGVSRNVGDHSCEIDDYELVFIGSHLHHCWQLNNCTNKDIHEITIQFHYDLFHSKFLSRKVLRPIQDMIKRSAHGISFSRKTILEVAPRLETLSKRDGLDAFLEFISILDFLANSKGQKLLSEYSPDLEVFDEDLKMKKINSYIKKNFDKKILLNDVAELIYVSNASLNRFIKSRTGLTFVNYLNKVRVENASRLLIDKDFTTAEVAFMSGFNNISNFNRIFKKVKNVTPSDYKKKYKGLTRFL